MCIIITKFFVNELLWKTTQYSEQKADIKTEKVDVVLESTNGNNIHAAKILKNHLHLSLEEARDLVLRCPAPICEYVEKHRIAPMLKEFDDIGAVYRIEPYAYTISH